MHSPMHPMAIDPALMGYNAYTAYAMMLQQMTTPIRSPAPIRQTTPGTRAARLTPARAERTPALQPANASAPTPTTRIQEDLRYASKEDLIDLLGKLALHSADAASFIDCQIQLWQLRSDVPGPQFNDSTPVKQIQARDVDGKSPGTPYEQMQADQNQPPEARQFCQERHPCVFHYRVCRNPKSCLFVNSPCNLCMAYVRGECPNGPKCTLVHRLPSDASPQLRHLFEAKHTRRD